MIERIIKKVLKEATSTGSSRGSYVAPLLPGERYFKPNVLAPFTGADSKYKSPDLAYDSYDGKMERNKKQIGKEERVADKIYNYIKNHPNATLSDGDGNPINRYPGKNTKIVPIKEWVDLDNIVLTEASSTSVSAGGYNGPISLGLKKWKKSELEPFTEFVNTEFNYNEKQKT